MLSTSMSSLCPDLSTADVACAVFCSSSARRYAVAAGASLFAASMGAGVTGAGADTRSGATTPNSSVETVGLVGFVLLYGHLAGFGSHAGRRLGARLLDKRRLDFHRRAVLALFIDQKRFTRLRGGASNVPQLTQIDIDLDGLVCGVPQAMP